ncbi:MAG: preprotein translocase subunit TatC [Archaeoglobus sp.]|uniref:twin-arginine translocase subunit TatC n=1 Tax=Archaeoglobus sp. TaxID=1872626 RepID=UPI001D42D5C3|nr:twin-arginine translocase subunit TatC [Archaeoglobus sp.]MBO8179098.1 preprotein translocase subunit TatC [Archaeoglobus sp.]
MEARDWLAIIARLRREFLKVALIVIVVSSIFFTFGANVVIGKIIGDLFPGEAVIENREKILAIAEELRKIASDLESYALHPSETNQSLALAASKSLVRIAMQLSTSPVLLTPLEGLLLYLKISLAVGIAAALPYIFHLVLTTLKDRGVVNFSLRRTTAFKYGIVAVLLFILGVIYGYNMMKFFIRFLYTMAVSQGAIPLYSLSEFVNFVALMLVLFGMVFELPLIMFFLVRNNIVSYETLSYYRRHIYVAFFVIGAITTPPDVFTQLMVAVPMVAFFEISLLFVRIFAR